MQFNDYQAQALKTAIYPDRGNNILYPTLGLCGEAGEVAELIKKMVRDDEGVMTPERKAKLTKELGDVLWYVAVVSQEAGIYLGDVAQGNLDKLANRKELGLLQGSGSDR